MNIILYGIRGTGKSSIGKALAEKLNKKFIDTDEARLQKFKQTTEEVVSKGGWSLFREQEKDIILGISKNFDNAIIATGGGTMMDLENAKALKKNAKAILLTADIDILAKRIYNDDKNKNNRPSLIDGKTSEQEVADIWTQRKDVYEKLADLVFDTSGLVAEEAVGKIINLLKI